MSSTEQETQRAIDKELARGGVETEKPAAEERAPTYKMIGDTKIATSSAHGKLWQSRRDQGLAKRRKKLQDVAWREAIDYYNNNQVPYRVDSDGNWSRSEHLSAAMGRGFSITENIVFANVSAMVPAIYAKNPTVAVSAEAEADEYPVPPETIEDLVNRIIQKRASPGINLKPTMRRATVHSTLTNVAYVECGYTFREQSNTAAMEDLADLSQKLIDAKDDKEIREIEGALQALEHSIDVLRPPGPWARFLRSDQLVRDPDSTSEDFSEDRFIMYYDYISSSYLQARFATKAKDSDEYRSVYEPSHVMSLAEDSTGAYNRSFGAPDEIYAFTLLDDDETSQDWSYYGYTDERAWRRALRTKCWWVWDRTTRRLYLYNDKDWTWPIWVWDDPYRLEGFFPVAQLTFYTDPNEGIGRSEVSYYLDQQDEINTINSEFKQARQWARRNLFFDKKRVSRDDVEKVIKGDVDCAVGVDVPEGFKLEDLVKAILPPSMQFVELFDKGSILEAVDRVSSVTDIQRGAEYKTNTTNVAIEQYSSGQQMRLDEKIDAEEDCIGVVGWMIGQMCLQFMDQETVARLIGPTGAQNWQNMSAEDISMYYSMRIVGGSTTKPTSSTQKQIALQIGQVLGQFVNAAPQAVTGVLLRVFNRAFDEVVISDEDWESLHQVMGSPGIGGNAPGAGDSGAPGGAGQDPIAMIEQLVDALPPEAKQALGVAMSRGVPVREALERIMGAAQQQAAA